MMENMTCKVCDSKSKCFQQLNDQELSIANSHRTQVNYRKSEIISKQGSFMTHILYLKTGFAKLYREVDNNKNIIFDIIPAGELIGLSTLFDDNIAKFSVAALEESQICSIDRKVIESLTKKNGDFSEQVIASINKQSRLFHERLSSITQKQMNGRVADALIYLSEKVFKNNRFKMILSRKDLADFTGMATMSAVRSLKELTKSKIISDHNGYIEILNKKALVETSLFN